MVFFICSGSITGLYMFNFKGAFMFLHVFNPIAFVACYLMFSDERERSFKGIFTAPIFFLLYLTFDYIRYTFCGEFMYGFFDTEGFTPIMAVVIGIITYVVVCLFALGLMSLNKVLHRKIKALYVE